MSDQASMCAACFDEVPLSPARCIEKPELRGNMGMYHCPDCGAMILGGFPHPPLCDKCQPAPQ